jgi:antirestriction protein ArdC
MANSKYATTKRDHYQELTDRIVALLEQGTRPWRKPWDPAKAVSLHHPVNAVTGRPYRGINVIVLSLAALAFPESDPRWCSYKQAADRGWQVRRGEKGTAIFFYKPIELKDSGEPEDDKDSRKTIPLLRSFTIFHASQIDGIPEFDPPARDATPWKEPEATRIILDNSKIEIRIGGDQAYYCPASDHIQLPPAKAFSSPDHWSSVAMHEASHWTGSPTRLNRDLSSKFGSEGYAREELRCEIASYFVSMELGIPADIPNHASYLASWVKILKQDRHEIFRAAADAQKITYYLLAFHPAYAAALVQNADGIPAQSPEIAAHSDQDAALGAAA